MKPEDFAQLIEELKLYLSSHPAKTFGIIGHTPIAYDLLSRFRCFGAEGRLLGIYDSSREPASSSLIKNFELLSLDKPDCVIIASDKQKEEFILKVLPYISPATKILFGGYGHFRFSDQEFDAVIKEAFVPSLANGYPNSLIHIFQCLKNAAFLNLKGVVAEFGMFKGGTTMLISRFIERLKRDWKVLGFDTFSGFPAPRSPLDMYAHPDCVYLDEEMVRRHVAGRNIEVIAGDVCETVKRLTDVDIVLAFVDTDNFTSARSILEVIQNRIVMGGSIVFDHFAGVDRHKYTLGERIAAKSLLADRRYFNLHGTGVFYRQS